MVVYRHLPVIDLDTKNNYLKNHFLVTRSYLVFTYCTNNIQSNFRHLNYMNLK